MIILRLLESLVHQTGWENVNRAGEGGSVGRRKKQDSALVKGMRWRERERGREGKRIIIVKGIRKGKESIQDKKNNYQH